jgi:hypothetical protein
MRNLFVPLVLGVAFATAGCVVKSSGSGTAQSPDQPPPDQPPPGEERVASSRAGDAQPAEPTPDNERVPSRRAEPAQPQPPARTNERVPSRRAEPPVQPQPPRSNERVPSRRARPNIPFEIEPTAGPVGTTVTIYGDFAQLMSAAKKDYWVLFGRVKARPITVTAGAVTVVVPKGAKSGAVKLGLRKRLLWTGEFSVTGVDEGILVPTEGGKGLLGAVYRLPPKSKQLPDFSRLGRPFATITVPNLRVKARNFKAGFPGLGGKDKLLEWFGIRFEGQLMVPKSGSYRFRTVSDDGSKVYIDGKLVVDNDGVHPPRGRDGKPVQLGAGAHAIVVEYFQGPRFQIALELYWQRPGARWQIVKPKFFRR